MQRLNLAFAATLFTAGLWAQDFTVPMDPPFEEAYTQTTDERYLLPEGVPVDSFSSYDLVELKNHRKVEHHTRYVNSQFASYTLIETEENTYRNEWDYDIARTIVDPEGVKQYDAGGSLLNEVIRDSNSQALSDIHADELATNGFNPMLPLPTQTEMEDLLSGATDLSFNALEGEQYEMVSDSGKVIIDPVKQMVIVNRDELAEESTPVFSLTKYEKTDQGFLVPSTEIKQYRHYSLKGYAYTKQLTQEYQYSVHHYDPEYLSEEAQSYLDANPFQVYPNPVENSLALAHNQESNPVTFTLTATDLYGTVVQPSISMTTGESLDVSSWEAGIYLLNIQYDNQTYQLKIQKL